MWFIIEFNEFQLKGHIAVQSWCWNIFLRITLFELHAKRIICFSRNVGFFLSGENSERVPSSGQLHMSNYDTSQRVSLDTELAECLNLGTWKIHIVFTLTSSNSR